MLFSSVNGGYMSTISTLKEMISEMKNVYYELENTKVNSRTYCDMINNAIKGLLSNYCQESEHFEAVRVYGVTQRENIGGGYSPKHNYIELDTEYLNYTSICNDMAGDYSVYTWKLEEAIDAYLHECRHAKQFADEMEITKVKYTDANEDIESYYEHPMEIDAREFAAEYLEEAIEYICDNLMDSMQQIIISIM